jgi:hypothetical protein
MWQAFMLARRYGQFVPDIIALVEQIQCTGKDGKLTNTERGQLISTFSRLIDKIGPGTAVS